MDYIKEKYSALLPLYQEIYHRGSRSYWKALDTELKEHASKIGLDYVTNDDSISRPFHAPPVIVNYFYHNEIKKSARKGAMRPEGRMFCTDRSVEVGIMPELPEIETIKSVIEPQIKGLAIENITVGRSEVIAQPTADKFCEAVTGQMISSMSRRGKFLIIHLKNKSRIILHLRMTGCLLVMPSDYPIEKHTHIIFHLSNGKELRFSDTRRFGRFWLIRNDEKDTYSGIEKLGLEPLSAGCNAEYLQSRLKKRKKAIKACLLDQSVIAGIGNIYSDEILYRARINPSAPANGLSISEWERLAFEIADCLRYFIDKNSISQEDYLTTKGQDYRNTPFLQVYGHAYEPCPNCGNTLCRTVIGGRSSVYCPVCQK